MMTKSMSVSSLYFVFLPKNLERYACVKTRRVLKSAQRMEQLLENDTTIDGTPLHVRKALAVRAASGTPGIHNFQKRIIKCDTIIHKHRTQVLGICSH